MPLPPLTLAAVGDEFFALIPLAVIVGAILIRYRRNQ